MAKRFVTTDIFDDAWFMDLPAKYKLFWLYLITKCDHAGIWQVNFKTAMFYVGEHLEPIECERIFRERIVKLEKGKYWFIPKFIDFQYGYALRTSNKAVKKVIETLELYDLLQFLPKTKIIEGATKELGRSYKAPKEKEKEKEKDKEKELKQREEEFKEVLLKYYPLYDKAMLDDFFRYWSEPNKSNSKMKFELQKTWDVSRRLQSWKINKEKWDGTKSSITKNELWGYSESISKDNRFK